MAKRALHMEWAKLKLIGPPLMASGAWETSPLLWLALRPLPRLLHIYLDSALQEVLQFPEDPIFLLFIPPERGSHAANKKAVMFPSLLVITYGGCIWRIPLADSSQSIDRCTKRLKQNKSHRINTLTTPRKMDEWDIFDDWDIYKDIELYPSQTRHKESSAISKTTHITWKPLQLRASGISPHSLRTHIRFVTNELLVGKLPGAHIAAVGPENLIAVVSPTSSPAIFIGNTQSATIPAEGEMSPPVRYGKPSCLHILSHNRYKSHWDAPCLCGHLFDVLCPSTSQIKISHLLLQGDMAGKVTVFPIQDPDQKILSSRILCDLNEPISDLVTTTLLQNDTLFVMSSLGRIAVISAARHDSTHNSSSALISESVKLFQVDQKDGIVTYDWRVPGPVVSPVLNGAKTLCFCSASDVCIVDLLKFFGNKTTPNSVAQEKVKPQQMTIQEFLEYKVIPIDDAVIALAGKGTSSPASISRSLVALTSRGRIIAVEISDHVLRPRRNVIMPTKVSKSWKPVVKKREENVKELINSIADVEAHTDGLQQMRKHIESAICELSSALWLCYNVVNSRNSLDLHATNSSVVTSSTSGISCNLEIHPVLLCVSREKLCFGPWSHVQTSSFDYDDADKVDYKFHMKVNISNHSSYPISSFWVMMLELQCEEKRDLKKLYFSNIINDGYGIAPGASSTIEFDIPCLQNYLTPVMASVFLCHLHENHIELTQGLSTANIGIPSVKNICKPFIKEDFLIPGAVVLAVARFRIDVLSLLRKPKLLQHLSSNKSSYIMMRSSKLTTNKVTDNKEGFGHFSVKFWLRDRQDDKLPPWDTLPTLKKWKEYHLEDLISFCSVSTDGDVITGSDLNSNRVVFAINGSHINKNNILLKEIHITADSLILGCLIRESVLWRLTNDTGSTRLVLDKKGNSLHQIDQMLTSVIEAEKRFGVTMCNTKYVDSFRNSTWQMSGSIDQFFSQVFDTLKWIVDIYRNYRGEVLWG